ncbi:PKD-like family lipoprotein [Odoribacter splanchnicus]|uniref:PKD-like family lipoprotein n=1 Tax=Odoribacter splanchnicus TaxID=28118 RepID=UPI00189B2688|nr:PKD-like family lipoprotein [Odoribacter splanchnicus]
MKKSILFLILMIGWLIEGCYEDKGHYNYTQISVPVVTGIEKFYTVYDGGNFDIHPTITWTHGELENYTCSWKVDGIEVSNKSELTEEVKSLPVKANMYSEFTITDEDTGVEYITQFRVTVSSVYERGWLLLADQGTTSMLSLVRNDKTVYEDVYRLANDADLAGGAVGLYEHWTPWSEEVGQVFVACQNGPEYSVELDGSSLKKMVATKEEFVGGMPADFKPMSMNCIANYDCLVSNGKLYVRHVEASSSAMYQDGLFPNFPYQGDEPYELSQWTARGNLLFSNEVLAFDKLSSSYMVFRNGSLSKFSNDYTEEPFFNPSNMNKTVLDGAAVDTESPQDDYLVFLKSNTDNTIYVQKFLFYGWRSPKSFYSRGEVEFPEPGIINENTKFAFCQNRPYVYIASGNTLYVYNHQDNAVRVLRDDFGRPIRDIAVCPTNYERLGIVLENAEDPGMSDFMVLDVSVVAGGKVVDGMEFYGRFGKVVDLKYKIGYQWDTY